MLFWCMYPWYDQNSTFFPKFIVPVKPVKHQTNPIEKHSTKYSSNYPGYQNPRKKSLKNWHSHMEPRVTYDTMWYPADTGRGNGY